MNSTEKLQTARQLIKEKNYTEARELLRTINHPTAKKWLIKIDEISPEDKSQHRRWLWFLAILTVCVLSLIVLSLILTSQRPTGKVEVASLPTIVELPTLIPSNTAIPTLKATSTSAATPTITPSPTITNTPRPTRTPIPSQTPLPTLTPLLGCEHDDWFSWGSTANDVIRQSQGYDFQFDTNPTEATLVRTLAGRKSLLVDLQSVPYPECMATPRSRLITYIEAGINFDEALLDGKVDTAKSLVGLRAQYLFDYTNAFNKVLQDEVINKR